MPLFPSLIFARNVTYGAISDLVLGIRAELSGAQLINVLSIYTRLMQSPHITAPVQSYCVKVLYGMLDVVVTKDLRKEAGEDKVAVFHAMFWIFTNKLTALVAYLDECAVRLEAVAKGEKTDQVLDTFTVERERPLHNATHASDSSEDNIKENIKGVFVHWKSELC